jgi:hypothetical protein
LRVVYKQDDLRGRGIECKIFDLLLNTILVKRQIVDGDRVFFSVRPGSGNAENGAVRVNAF